MHDIRAIRENPDQFDAALARRGLSPMSSQVLALDEARRALIHAAETAQAAQNAASKLVGAAKAKGGSGAKISGKAGRAFKPNLQTVRAEVEGSVKSIRVCTSCLSAGKVKKAAKGQMKLRKAMES